MYKTRNFVIQDRKGFINNHNSNDSSKTTYYKLIYRGIKIQFITMIHSSAQKRSSRSTSRIISNITSSSPSRRVLQVIQRRQQTTVITNHTTRTNRNNTNRLVLQHQQQPPPLQHCIFPTMVSYSDCIPIILGIDVIGIIGIRIRSTFDKSLLLLSTFSHL